MNPNEETQNQKLSPEDLPTAENTSEHQQESVTASDAATDLSTRLNAYEKWQQDYAHLLFDGTYSQATYIRLAGNGDIEYGLQPRFGFYGSHLAVGYRLRVSHVIKVRTNDTDAPAAEVGSMDEADAKVAALYAFMQLPANGNPWAKEDPSRLSTTGTFKIPLKGGEANLLPQFLALVENGLLDKLIETLPIPNGGWDTGALRQFKQCLLDYLRLSANQFGLFKHVQVTENLWELDSAVGELTPELVEFLNGNGGEQGGSHDPDTEE